MSTFLVTEEPGPVIVKYHCSNCNQIHLDENSAMVHAIEKHADQLFTMRVAAGRTWSYVDSFTNWKVYERLMKAQFKEDRLTTNFTDSPEPGWYSTRCVVRYTPADDCSPTQRYKERTTLEVDQLGMYLRQMVSDRDRLNEHILAMGSVFPGLK